MRPVGQAHFTGVGGGLWQVDSWDDTGGSDSNTQLSNSHLIHVYNKWVMTLLIAAVLQLYSTHRVSHELEKEAKKL